MKKSFPYSCRCPSYQWVQSPNSPSPCRNNGGKTLSHRGKREALLQNNGWWQWKRTWAASLSVRDSRRGPQEDFQKGTLLSITPQGHSRNWLVHGSPTPILCSSPLLTTLICYHGRVHHQHHTPDPGRVGSFPFPDQQAQGCNRGKWGTEHAFHRCPLIPLPRPPSGTGLNVLMGSLRC